MFKFGVSSLIWTEKFLEKDLGVIQKAKTLGFEAIDILILNPDTFPTKLVKKKAAETDKAKELWEKSAEILNSGGEE